MRVPRTRFPDQNDPADESGAGHARSAAGARKPNPCLIRLRPRDYTAQAPGRIARDVTIRRLTGGAGEYFFGHYEKSPWDPSDHTLPAMRAKFRDRQPKPHDVLTIRTTDLDRAAHTGAGEMTSVDSQARTA